MDEVRASRRPVVITKRGKPVAKLVPVEEEETGRYTYIAYDDGERELYDLDHAPYQLDNIEPGADPALIETLATRLTQLRACRAEECRDYENRPIE